MSAASYAARGIDVGSAMLTSEAPGASWFLGLNCSAGAIDSSLHCLTESTLMRANDRTPVPLRLRQRLRQAEDHRRRVHTNPMIERRFVRADNATRFPWPCLECTVGGADRLAVQREAPTASVRRAVTP